MRIRLLALVVCVAFSTAAPASGRQVEGFSLTNPPGAAEKTFAAIPSTNPNFLMPPHYELCEHELATWCDSFAIDIDPGGVSGHVVRFRLTWGPNPGPANRLDMILYNPRVRQICRERARFLGLDTFCGSEARDIGTRHPKGFEIYDLPPGTYVMNVINQTGRHASYTLRGEIELVPLGG